MKILVSILLLLIGGMAFGQDYTLKQLTQEQITRTRTPRIQGPKMAGDTVFTVYTNSSVDLRYYFVNGDQYDNLFNPNPTGVYLNYQQFNFYCDVDNAFKQPVNGFVDVYEFTYLGRNYLCIFTLREASNNNNNKCYNLFDITDPKNITQSAFPSIHQGEDSFGDFNADGVLDFVKVSPKAPETAQVPKTAGHHYLITSYTVKNGRAVQLKNDQGMPHYIFVKSDESLNSFTALQQDWVIPIKDASGAVAKKPYYSDYIKFNPKDPFIYTVSGVRVDKQRWSVMIGSFNDIGGAEKMYEIMEAQSRRLVNFKNEEIYIMTDQYGGAIKFLVLFGNFMSKEQALSSLSDLKRLGINGSLRDLKSDY